MKNFKKMMIVAVCFIFSLTLFFIFLLSEADAKAKQNYPPGFDHSKYNYYVFANETMTFSVLARDKNKDPLTYTDPKLPVGATIDPVSRAFTWTPTHEQLGKYYLSFVVSDGTYQDYRPTYIQVIEKMPPVDFTSYMPPVGNQGRVGSCASWATGYYYKSFQENIEHNWDPRSNDHRCSPMFLFNQVSIPCEGGGMGSYPSHNIYLMMQQGCAPLSAMSLPGGDRYEAAMPFRSKGFSEDWNYEHLLTSLRKHLASGDIFVVTVPVYADYLSANGGNDVHDGGSGKIVGYHALTIVGYDDNRVYTNRQRQRSHGAFKAVNSWGSGWSGNGYFWLSYDFVNSGYVGPDVMTDRSGYYPKAIARFQIAHPRREDLSVALGVAQQANPFWHNDFGRFNINDAAVDLTDYTGNLPPSPINKWYLSVTDSAPGRAGRIDTFKIKYRTSQNEPFQEYGAGDLPANIPDASAMYPGANIYSYIPSSGPRNNPPSRPNVTISPLKPKTTDSLVASCIGSIDPDGDPVTYRYAWYSSCRYCYYKFQPDLTTNTVPAGRAKKGETWRCAVIPNDGKMDGSVGAAETVIVNSVPVLQPIGNKTVKVGTFLGFSTLATDADGDSLTYKVKGLPKGANFNSANSVFSWTPTKAGKYKITFTVLDGTPKSSDSETITITVAR